MVATYNFVSVYFPSVDDRMQSTFFQGFLRNSDFNRFKKVYHKFEPHLLSWSGQIVIYLRD